MKLKLLGAIFLVSLGLMHGCKDATFAPDSQLTKEQATPRNLNYADLVNAREFGLITSGIPTVETGGIIPEFTITAGWDANGQQLSDSYMQHVSISSPTLVNVGSDQEPINAIQYRRAGIISIQAGNPFDNGDYYFDVKVSVTYNGEVISTTFPKGFKVNVEPALPSALIYIPMGQNIIQGSGSSSTALFMPSGNPDVHFELGSDTDKLTINPTTGAISMKDGYQVQGEREDLTPVVVAVSGISGERVEFNSVVIIILSTTAITIPLQSKIFYAPLFKSNNTTDGNKIYIIKQGSSTPDKLWQPNQTAAGAAATERPSELADNKSMLTNPTVNNVANAPHESWCMMVPQDLSNFSYGFDLTSTFWLYNQYVSYLSTNGQAPMEIAVKVSSDYNLSMTDPSLATWTDVTSRIECSITGTGTPFTGLPYPGNNASIGVNDQFTAHKDVSKHYNAKWLKCMLNLDEWKNSKSFTLAFHISSNFTGTITFANNLDRMGRYQLSDLYYTATEKANP